MIVFRMSMTSLALTAYFLIICSLATAAGRVKSVEPEITCVSQFDYDYKTLQKVVEMEQFQKELMKTVADQQKMIEDLIESGERGSIHVAFTAKISPAGLTSLKPGEILIFDSVITNIGQAYDNRLGIFTAPVGGMYIFNMDIMVRAGQREYIEFIKNGNHVMWNYGHAPGAGHYVSSSRLVALHLALGDRVWIRTQDRASHGDGVIHGNGFSTFSGWLIAAEA